MSALLEIRDLVIEYDSGGYAVRPLDGFNLEAEPGELVVLLGRRAAARRRCCR